MLLSISPTLASTILIQHCLMLNFPPTNISDLPFRGLLCAPYDPEVVYENQAFYEVEATVSESQT